MEIIIDVALILAIAVSIVVGAGLSYLLIIGKDELAITIITACEDIMDEYGKDILNRDPKLYAECIDVIESMKEMATDGTTFAEFIKFATTAPKMFKGIVEYYNIAGEMKATIEKIKK